MECTSSVFDRRFGLTAMPPDQTWTYTWRWMLTYRAWRHDAFFVQAITILIIALSMPLVSYAADNAIVVENQKQGTLAWQIGLSPYSRSDDTTNQIRGYASAASINKGESITFYVTVNPVQTYSIDVYRIGWYNGAGGRLMQHLGALNGVKQPSCPVDPNTGMIVCPWSASYTLDTSANTLSGVPDWTSGIYLVLLTNTQNYQSYITFVIRDDARRADLLFQQSVTTYQAYNDYPDDSKTGKSLYDGGSYGPKTSLGTQRAVKVSFDRPYTYIDHTGAGELLHWEIYFLRWLEKNGYDVAYSTDIDTHTNGSRLLSYKAFLVVGHDEYWSKEMYDAADAARDGGTNLAFFGANGDYWQIRFEPSASGVPNRVIVCYKDAALDPVGPPLTTVTWRSSTLNRAEQKLMGVMYTSYIDAELPALAYVVKNSAHWVYSGTGFQDGDSVPGILGYEFDRNFSGYPNPPAVNNTYTFLSLSPFVDFYNVSDYAQSSIYQASSGAWVFAAGTIDWSWGLDNYVPPAGINTRGGHNAADPRIQRTTANILNRFINGSATGLLDPPTNLAATAKSVNEIDLRWQDNSSAEDNFVLERSGDSLFGSVVAITLPANTTVYADLGLAAGTYYYRVKAINATGASAYSNTSSASTLPAAPTGLAVTATGHLTWTDNAANETAYTVERSGDNSTWSVLTSNLAANTVVYDDTTISPFTNYYYRVKATNASGSSAYSNTAALSTAPAAPTNLTAKVGGGANSQKVTLTWTDKATNETAYRVERRLANDTTWTVLTQSLAANTTSFTDNGPLQRATTYYYQVAATNSVGASYSSVVSVRTK